MDIIMDNITSETLAELEKTQKEFWNVPRKTGVLLNMFIKMMNAQNVLEIGTSNGYSGLWLAKALKETGGKLTTIEYYDKRQSIAIENFKKCTKCGRTLLRDTELFVKKSKAADGLTNRCKKCDKEVRKKGR